MTSALAVIEIVIARHTVKGADPLCTANILRGVVTIILYVR